ncbi:MAG: diphthine synthase [Thermoprotei archaeon]
MAFVGLGLCADCVSLRALNILKASDYIYFDTYTSYAPQFGWEELSKLVGKVVTPLQREDVEDKSGRELIEKALNSKVSFASVGDPFIATTHVYIRNVAMGKGITTLYVPGVSIHSAAFSLAGLQIYKSGPTATVVEPFGVYKPKAAFEKVVGNLKRGLHTLLLLDIDVVRGKFMSFSRGAHILAQGLKEYNVDPDRLLGVGLCAVGTQEQKAIASTISGLNGIPISVFPQSLIVPGRLDVVEAEALMFLGVNQEQLAAHARLIEELGR